MFPRERAKRQERVLKMVKPTIKKYDFAVVETTIAILENDDNKKDNK